jgi:hypothetical protein
MIGTIGLFDDTEFRSRVADSRLRVSFGVRIAFSTEGPVFADAPRTQDRAQGWLGRVAGFVYEDCVLKRITDLLLSISTKTRRSMERTT